MNPFPLHLAPQSPWIPLLLGSLVLGMLGLWAYRFRLPPLPPRLRALLTGLRLAALLAVLWLLAQPVLERPHDGRKPRVVALVDRSASMQLAGREGGTRAQTAGRAVESLRRALRGRAELTVMGFGAGLEPADADSGPPRAETALGTALQELAGRPESQDLGSVVVLSDGVLNAGADPQSAAAALGVPVHALLTPAAPTADRAVVEVEASPTGRVGEAMPVRVHFSSDEPRGERVTVRVLAEGREMARTEAVAPGSGAEGMAELRVTPTAPGLALLTARLDSLPAELTTANNARIAAVEVLPGKLGVAILSGGLNWDLTFLRRALAGDSALAPRLWVRGVEGWRGPAASPETAPGAAAVRRQAVIVLDGVGGEALGAELQGAILETVRGGAGLLLLGGNPPGLMRFRGSVWGEALLPAGAGGAPRAGAPAPEPGARELLEWDEDAARGDNAWRSAAPLSAVLPIQPSGGDRVLLGSAAGGPPLFMARHLGRGQVLLVNGAGFWRWGLASGDPQAGPRNQRLWRRLVRWLAEPAQGEPLRVRPEQRVTARGESPRLLADLQDAALRPVGDARVEAELVGPSGTPLRVSFTPGVAGSYTAALPALPPGRYRVSARALRGGAELGRAQTELAVDRWSLEEARAPSDSIAMLRLARATGGTFGDAADAERWARGLAATGRASRRIQSLRLWESPWTFATLIGLLGAEWFMRRRRGLP